MHRVKLTGFWVDALPKGPLGLYDTPDIPALILFQHVIISRRSRRLRDLLALEMFLLISAVHLWGTTELFLWIKYSKNTPPSPSSYLPVHLRSHGRVWAGPHSLTYQETRGNNCWALIGWFANGPYPILPPGEIYPLVTSQMDRSALAVGQVHLVGWSVALSIMQLRGHSPFWCH